MQHYVAPTTSRLHYNRHDMALLSNTPEDKNKPENSENEKPVVIHTEAQTGRDLPPLAIDEIIQKLNDDDVDPDVQYHFVHSLRKHTVKSPQVIDDIVALGTLVPMLVSSLRSLR